MAAQGQNNDNNISLHDLLDDIYRFCDWDAIVRRLRTHPHEAAEIDDEIYNYQYSYSTYGSPLHKALLTSEQPAPVNAIQALVNAFPFAATTEVRDCDGRTAPHLAVKNYALSAEVISIILKADPSCASQQDRSGKLPHHYVYDEVETDRDLKVLQMLQNVHPLSAEQLLGMGGSRACDMLEYPDLQYLNICYHGVAARVITHPREAEPRLLHRLLATVGCNDADSIVSAPVMQALIDAFPFAATAQALGSRGETALHVASENIYFEYCHIAADAFRILARVDPNSASQADSGGMIPLHYAKTAEFAQILLEVFPEGIRTADNNGRLPLHIAVSQLNANVELLKCLVGAEPRALLARDVSTQMYPFLTAAAGSNSSLDCVYYLLRQAPNVLAAAYNANKKARARAQNTDK